MSNADWGLMERADAGPQRRTRGLGLGSALRTFNELAVPGIGWVRFGKPFLWALLGVKVAGLTGRTNIEVTNAIEALACWHGLVSNSWEGHERLSGRTKLQGVPPAFVPFERAKRRSFYVTVPLRMGTVQPLLHLGLVRSQSQRFNAYRLSAIGEDVLEAALRDYRPYRTTVEAIVAEWVRGDNQRVYTEKMQLALNPLTPLPKKARDILFERLATGDPRRKAALDWAATLQPTTEPPTWTPPPSIAADHWADLRAGATFVLLRDAAIRVLDTVEALLKHRAQPSLNLDEATKDPIQPALVELAESARLFTAENHDPTDGSASAFARACVRSDALAHLVRLDDRGLRLRGNVVVPGPVFRGNAPVPAQPAQGPQLPLPAGISGRIAQLVALRRDLLEPT